ncbi:CMRF35-like molecule 9 isoform X4 [Arvicanthis niloticus]|uniref:CMRF35-like molecule 9 isoform X4 n=1 Tax=Arvicanthis niloticus TaxID=61156 RepID=UPI001486F98C|nr:CMRF35-like molecule 9 isoform X3 [Arvicanthis niloticus]
MRPLVLLWGCLVLPGYEALKGPKEISGFEGDTVSLECTYEKKMERYRKYWCRQGGILLPRCSDIIYTSQDQEVTQGMMSILDSPQELSMTVTMRDLTLKDSGKYWCGIDRLGLDESFEVTLIVFPGSSRPVIWLPLTTTKDSRAATSSISKPSVSIPMVRMMAPVLVLLSLLLAAGLIAFGSHMLRWRNKVWLATQTQKNKKVYLETSPPRNGWTPEDLTVDLAVSPERLRNPNPSAVPSPESQSLSQSTEEEAARSLDAMDVMAPPPLQMSTEELAFSEFISV